VAGAVSQRGQLVALLDLLGRPWPWDSGLSQLIDAAVLEEEAK
jgi:hypothetical protein